MTSPQTTGQETDGSGITRRSVAAIGATLLSAGCLDTISSAIGGNCEYGVTVSAERFEPVEQLPIDFSKSQRRLVDRLALDEPTEVSTYVGTPPIRDGVFLEVDATYYRTDVSQAGTTEIPAYTLDIEWEAGQQAPSDATVVAFSALPETDRRALEFAIEGPELGREKDRPSERFTMDEVHVPYPNGTDDSRLVDADVIWVRWNDRTYRVAPGGATTTTRYTLRYSLTRVADTAEGFRAHVVEQSLIRLSDVTDAEGSILEQAAGEDAYEECKPASEELTRLRDRLPEDRQLPHPHKGDWFVAFEGTRYRLTITSWAR